MPSFDLATGYVTFKGNFDQYEKDIKKATVMTQELGNALSTKQFEMAAWEAKRINDEFAKAAKQAKKITDNINLGKFGVFVRDFKQSMDKFAAGAAKMGAWGTGIGGAALATGAAGSPLASSTLEGSFKLLMTEIGGTFTPLVMDASRALQDMRKMWKGMSDEMKGLINEGAKFIGIAGMAALGLSAVAKGLSLIATHPLIAGASFGIGTGVAVNSLWSAATDRKIAGIQEDNAATSMKDVKGDAQWKAFEGMNPEAAKRASMEDFSAKWIDFEKKRQSYEEYRTGFGGGNIRGGFKRLGDITGMLERDLIDSAGDAEKELEKSKLRAVAFGNEMPGQRAGAKNNMLLGAMGPASMTDVQGMFRAFQMAGAGTSQIEAEIKKQERENAQKMLANSNRSVELLGEIKDNLPIKR